MAKIAQRKNRRVLLALGWYATDLHRGVAAYARSAGWALNIDMERGSPIPHRWGGDGIICVLGMNSAIDQAVLEWELPAVSIGPFSTERIPQVMPDNNAIGKLAGEHFLMRGFRNFAYYVRSGGLGERLRMEGFQRRLAEAGHELTLLRHPAGIRNGKSDGGSEDLSWVEKQLSKLRKPLAVFTEYDDRALEILNACENAGLAVPEQVAVLGVDNDELRCVFATTPLSSVDDDQAKQGYEAARLLDTLMKGGTPRERRVLVQPKGVVTRKSTDILAVDHPNVAKALRLIWEHYTEPITAEVIAKEIPMSSRRLHDAFVQHVGRSMAEELSRRRVEHAQRLLEDRERRKMEAIAESAGFTSADHMCKIFTRTLKISPSAYRREKTLG